MLHKLFILIAVAVMLNPVAPSPGGVTEADIIRYMGWYAGSVWNYSYRDIEGRKTRVMWSVESVRRFKGGTAVIIVEYNKMNIEREIAYLIAPPKVYESDEFDEEGWLRELERQRKYDSPFLIFPIVKGAKWGGPLEIPEGEVLDDSVSVRVPAGTFKNCLKVKIQLEDGSTVYWICPEIGIVKTESIIAGYEGKETMMLRHYKITGPP